MKDRELLELMEKDPEKGWAALIDRFSGLLFYIVRGKLGQRFTTADAEDVVAEAFAQAYRDWHRFDANRSSVKTYLASIAAHRAIDFCRSHRPIVPADAEETPEIASEDPDPLERFLEEERKAELLSVIRSLSRDEKRLLALRFWEEKPSKEIGRELALTPAAVDQRMHRLLRRLRRILGGN